MTKQIQFRDDAREAIRRGVCTVVRAARKTLGPRGRHVIIQREDGSLVVTKDGVTVVQQITLEDPFENVGAQLVRQVATAAGELAGDGTTTASVLVEAIFVEGLKAVVAGVNPVALSRGAEQAVQDICAELRKMSLPGNDRKRLRQVATIASNGDEVIGELVAEVLTAAGDAGLVTIGESRGASTTVEWIDGMSFDQGYFSPFFVNDTQAMEAALDDVAVLVCDHTISLLADLLPILEQASGANQALLIVADDVQGEALSALVVNASRGTLRSCAVKSPGFGDSRRDLLEDLGIFTGCSPVLKDAGSDLKRITLGDLGRAKRAVIGRERTTVLGGRGTKQQLDSRVKQLQIAREAAAGGQRGQFDLRIAQLRGRVANILVGAATESALHETKARLEDALNAARAAYAEGIVPGGGVALLRAAAQVKSPKPGTDFQTGYRLILHACAAPLTAIAENAGRSGSAVCYRVAEGEADFGYDAGQDNFSSLLRSGIVDATKVVRQALESASGLALTLLGSDAIIAERR